MKKRPLSITIIGWISILIGAGGLIHHGWEALEAVRHSDAKNPAGLDEWVMILVVQLLALVGGVFLLRGRNFARWLLVAWMGFHVGISAMHSIHEMLVHSVFFIVLVYFLFAPKACAYFRGVDTEAPPNKSNQNS
jgi:hypothetical protein